MVAQKKQTTPAARPITSAPIGPTVPAAGVTATRPATTPEAIPSALGLPWVSHSASIQPSAAAAVAICVTSIAMPAVPLAAAAEPALKPNQPIHSMAAPIRV
ncbi:hypothetical protein D3C84_798540 [compost metagenome]